VRESGEKKEEAGLCQRENVRKKRIGQNQSIRNKTPMPWDRKNMKAAWTQGVRSAGLPGKERLVGRHGS